MTLKRFTDLSNKCFTLSNNHSMEVPFSSQLYLRCSSLINEWSYLSSGVEIRKIVYEVTKGPSKLKPCFFNEF